MIEEYKELLNLNRIENRGKSERIFGDSLFKRIRKRLNLTKKELPDKKIKEILYFTNQKVSDFIFDNPEGIQLTIGEDLLGVLAISKHMPKELRENKFEKIEEIEKMNIPYHSKKIILRRYNTDLERRLDRNKAKKGEISPIVNIHTYLYTYKLMWFNHRNCKIRKAIAYEFEGSIANKNRLYKVLHEGKDYFELNFNDFYRFKVKPNN